MKGQFEFYDRESPLSARIADNPLPPRMKWTPLRFVDMSFDGREMQSLEFERGRTP